MSKDKEKKHDHSEHNFDFNTNWYELWTKQSKDFFETADKNLKNMFTAGAQPNPEEHMQQINQWLEAMKKQWQIPPTGDHQKIIETYWKTMAKMCSDASDLMVQQWIKRNNENNPIKSIHDLYQLWLNSCNEIYTKAMHSKTFPETYGEFMNAAINFWKASMPK